MKRKRSLSLIVAALLVLGLVGTGLAFYLQGYRVYVVHTGSMEPNYLPGDVVVDGPASGDYHRGEVITFLHSALTDDVVTHRVVGVTPQGLIHTKGDANRTPDVWNIRPDQVQGNVRFKVHGLGYLFVYFREPTGIASLATGLLAIVLLWGMFFPAADDFTRIRRGGRAHGPARVRDLRLRNRGPNCPTYSVLGPRPGTDFSFVRSVLTLLPGRLTLPPRERTTYSGIPQRGHRGLQLFMSAWTRPRLTVRLPIAIARPETLLAGGLLLWWIVVIALPESMTAHGQVAASAHFLAGEIFFVGGVAGAALWRMQRRPEVLRSAVGFIALGMALPALQIATPWTADYVTVAPTAAVLRCAVLIPVFALLTRPKAVTAGARRSSPRTAALVIGTPVVFVALLAEVIADSFSPAAAQRTVAAAVELTAMLCWILLGAQRRRMPVPGSSRWAAVGMFLMATTEFMNAVGLTGLLPPIGLAAGVQLAAAVTIAALFVERLRAAYRDQRLHADSLSDKLAETSQLLMRLEQDHRERLHDARSAVFGVIGASELLATPREPGAGVDVATLQRLIAEELIRLQNMLDTKVSEPLTDFDAAGALAPVLLAHQIDGAPIRVHSLSGAAHGRGRACATVLDNLLRNARSHAPGAAITVTVGEVDDQFLIVVDDDGPGIAANERMAVLLPGVRGSTARGPGSGLGLHSCLAAMSAQGGEMSLGESATGGLRVMLRLPVATREPELIAS